MSDLAYRCSLKMKTPGNLNTAWKHYVHHITETRNQLDLIKCNILPSTSSRLQLWSDFGKYTPLMIAKYTTPLAVNSKEAAGRVKRNGDSSSNSQKTSNSVTTPQSPYYGFSEEGLSSRLTPVAHSRASQSRGKSRGTSAVAVLDPVSSPMKISRSVIFTPRSRQASVTATGISTITTETAGDHTLSIPSSLADNITNLLTPQNLNVDWLVQLMISLGSTLETEEQGDELDIVISDQSQSAAESSSKIEEIFE